MQEIVPFETDEKFWITSGSPGKPREWGVSRQLTACPAVSDPFSSRRGEVCCDSCAEKSEGQVDLQHETAICVWKMQSRLRKGRKHRETNERNRIGAESKACLTGCGVWGIVFLRGKCLPTGQSVLQKQLHHSLS